MTGNDSGNARDNPGVIARPPLIYLAFLAPGFVLDAVWPAPPLLPVAAQVAAGLALIALGAAVIAAGIRRFQAAGTNVETREPTTAIVTDGPFRYSRNPIYLSLALIYAGIAIAADNLWALALLAPTLVVIRHGVIAREERYLERKFGDAYLGYKAQVRRWL